MEGTGVQFNDKFQLPNSTLGGGKTSKMAGWVIKISGGLIKDEKQANYALLVFVLLAVISSFFLILSPRANQEVPFPVEEVDVDKAGSLSEISNT